MQAGLYLTATLGYAAPEARICYERAEPLCQSLGRPVLLCVALRGLWRYSLISDKLSATMQIAERLYSLAQEHNESALLKAEALYLARRTSEALEAISEAEAMVERFEGRHWSAELHRLKGVFLTAMGGDEAQIEASFCAAIKIAREQKSISLEKRAEATYAEYCRRKATAPAGDEFRLPLC